MIQHQLTASQEDYLEAVFHIVKEKQAARAKDIASRLQVKASSVTTALRMLSSYGLINYSPYDIITLTADGLEAAQDIVNRHEALNDFFITVLGVEAEEADLAACRMEHAIPKEIVARLIQYASYIRKCTKGGVTWDSGFGYYCRNECDHPERCNRAEANQMTTKKNEDAKKQGRKEKTAKKKKEE